MRKVFFLLIKYKYPILIFTGIVIINAVSIRLIFNHIKNKALAGPYYEVLVQTRDQISSNPKEDARASLKKGDVIAVYPKGFQWSDAEKTSKLILKLNISEEDAKKLMKPEEKNGEITKARAYRIKIENLNYDPEKIWKNQPFGRKVFDEGIIEKK